MELTRTEDYRAAVRRELEAEVRASRRHPGIASPNFETLWSRLEGTVAGGKWLRPRLVHFGFRAYGGTDHRSCARLGAAFEMLHAALLVHDDVIDRDFVRRGAPTVGALYRDEAALAGFGREEAEHAGHSASIIAGDLLLAGAVKLAATAGAAVGRTGEIVDVVHGAIQASAAGELDDLLFSLAPEAVELDQVLTMERLKTAAYSFEAPLHAGALLAGAEEADAARLGSIGRRIGTAYQVVDDVLGTFGDPATTGKSIESDLRGGKRTVLTAFASADPEFTAAWDAYRRSESGVAPVREALRASGAETRARALAAGLVSAALEEAAGLGLDPARHAELESIARHVLNREH
ncbi:polyprenyl synthetase family protein [Arthrobacter sp. KK5.5]|uniref:polyprenyl synthetase family protein n=1 Tax=Arthrobacter sp. KK5.5 TaxID=3373084 RepID=UPI003EE45BF1